jgi:hypothetical protein
MGHAGKGRNVYMQDDRTAEQKRTHTLIVLATDRWMSGWGKASGGASYAGWACTPEDLDACEAWVSQRSDMRNVRVVGGNYRPRAGAGHCRVYVWTPR